MSVAGPHRFEPVFSRKGLLSSSSASSFAASDFGFTWLASIRTASTMPVTFVATSNKVPKGTFSEGRPSSVRSSIQSSKVFEATWQKEQKKCGGGSSSEDDETSSKSENGGGLIVQQSAEPANLVFTSSKGLLSAVTTAYNGHYDLIIDPNDVWITILAQFSSYLNGEQRAEKLRDRIVDFNGKKTLTVQADGTLFTVDFGSMAVEMVDQIAKNIKDPSLREWFLPGFSTTTTTDQICASVACMSALQSYFEYRFCLCCGIPNVTLQGTVDDWKLLRSKIDRLAEFDLNDKLMSRWLHWLRPICDHFVRSAEGKPDLAFWDQVCSLKGGGSGPTYLSGWVTAFSVFSNKGRWQGPSAEPRKQADGMAYWPQIDTQDLSHNQMSVPVVIDDNGTEYASMLFAGQFVYERVAPSALRPRSDWAIAIKAEDAPKRPADKPPPASVRASTTDAAVDVQDVEGVEG